MNHGEDGFTLIELLVAMLIGLLIIGSAVAVLTTATRQTDDVQRRTAAMQSGRLALDTVARVLRSQVCVPSSTGFAVPIAVGQDSTMTFYTTYSANPSMVERHVLTFASAGQNQAGSLTDAKSTATITGSAAPTWSAATTSTIATNLAITDKPIFRYYEANNATPLPTPLSAEDREDVVSVTVQFAALPEGAQVTQNGNLTRTTTLTDDVFVRLVDPDGAAAPACA